MQAPTIRSHGRVWEVFVAFLALGVTSFGGPAAHLGYFRSEFVERRRWLDDREYGDLVALSQFLPGPASSQVGFGIGMLRAGAAGALAAFVGFTAPSAALMLALAYGTDWFSGRIGHGVTTGLKIVAVAIVAHAVWGMARTLTPDRSRAGIAVAALGVALLIAGPAGQICAIVLGIAGGLLLCRDAVEQRPDMARFPVSRASGGVALLAFLVLLVGAPLLAAATGAGAVTSFDAFYRAGALVFGGGHVVLPLLHAGVVEPGWVGDAPFLSGYAVAQALPGPLFAFAGYLGAISHVGPGGIAGGLIALLGVFLPGFLLLVGVLPFWNALRRRAWAQAVMRGASAAVVGILAAALYSPVFTSAVTTPAAFVVAALCFVALTSWRVPPWVVVVVGAGCGVVIGGL